MHQDLVLPSAHAARRVACPGSRVMETKCDTGQESEYAREGKAAHWIAAHLLSSALPQMATNPEPASNTYADTITEEMRECALMYVSDILDTKSVKIVKGGIEQKFNITSIHPNCFGTPDCWMWEVGHLYIWDYKFGHTPVEAFENWQLISYAAALIQHLKINGNMDQHTLVTMRIVQPRSFTESGRIKEWTIKACDLRGYFNQLQAAEYKALEPNAPCHVSSQCSHCPARAICPTLQQAALTAIDISKSNTPWELDSPSISAELRFINHAMERLEARQTGLEEQIIARLGKGERIPHFSLGTKSSKQVWNISVAEAEKFAELYNANIFKPLELITPKQAITAGIPKKQVDKKSKIVTGKIQLIEVAADAGVKAFGGD